MARSLYICYFGMREPLVQTQVLPYLRELRKDGHEISLLTFDPPESRVDDEPRTREALRAEGIDWHSLAYHKRFSVLATAYDIFRGVLFTRAAIKDKQLDILHARVHVPALMAAIARKLSRRKPKLLFDIRGFMPEEYTDAGVWPENGWLYRMAKRVERWLLRESDGFVVLTEKAREILFPESAETGTDRFGRPVEVIPCCVDLSRFSTIDNSQRERTRAELGVSDRFVIIYVGSFGGWYMTNEMIDLFDAARAIRSDSFTLILTQRDHEKIEHQLRSRGFAQTDFLVRSVRPDEIPQYLASSDVAVSFIKACYSKLSSSPTKIAEYLAGGLPIIANSGVGDVDRLIEDHQVGVILDELHHESYNQALASLAKLNGVRGRAISASYSEFDLAEVGGIRYRRLYERLVTARPKAN